MSVKSSKSSKVAYMQEEDDKGNIREGVVYAASTAPNPSKTRMNISRKKSRQGESPTGANLHTDSDSTAHPSRHEPHPSRSSRSHRDRPVQPEDSPGSYATHSMPRHSPPVIETSSHPRHQPRGNRPTYYGAGPSFITSAAARPRSKTAAPRPNNYYALPCPPVSNQRYHSMMHYPPPLMPSHMPPSPAFAPSPLQHWQQPPTPGYGMMGPPLPPMHPGGQHPPSRGFQPPPPPPLPLPLPTNSFGGDPRVHPSRFGISRSQTSMGHRPPPSIEYGRSGKYDTADELSHKMRRLSMSHRPGIEDGWPRGMPPPMRTTSARPMAAAPFNAPPLPPYSHRPMSDQSIEPFQPLPSPSPRPKSALQPRHFRDDENPFDVDPYREYGPVTHVPRSRHDSMDSSLHESRPYTEVARTTRSRRNSLYGDHSDVSSNMEDQLRLATSYQDERSGGLRLTAEVLHEAGRRGPQSRSTRSSESRDESDWLPSATTRTTRSSNEDDLTIRVRGNAVFKYRDAEMQCQDGTEIQFRGPPNNRRFSTTETGHYPEIEDSRSRFDRPALRDRAASRARSRYGRSESQYGYSYGGSPEYDASPFDPR
ncbi:MAG: hypothetical protein SEPTF4163_004530 [Sporothrix epigloea]